MTLLRAFIVSLLLTSAASVGSSSTIAADGSWPQWRGPLRDGKSTETGLKKRWSSPPEVVWKTSGLGVAYSSVVVGDGRVFTIGKHGEDEFAFAMSADTGELLWKTPIGQTTRNPCSTPTLDGERVYVLSPDGDLCCLRVSDGELQWRRQFMEELGGRLQSGRGYGESVLIDGDSLVCTPGGKQHTIVKLNKHTGELQWSCSVPELGEKGGDGAGFASIVPTTAGGIRQYVQLLGRGLVGVRADDGQFLWGYNAIANPTANIPTPVVHEDLVFAANGYNAGSVLLRLVSDGDGGIEPQEVYYLNGSKYQNHHGGFALIDGCIYGGHGSNNGLPTCVELETGKVLWKRRGPGVGSASIVYADGHLYFHYQDGVIALIEANRRRYRLKGTFHLPGAAGDSWAHPVVTGGRLYLREKDTLWVYNVAAE